MAFGPVNTGGGASGRTLETIYESIAEARREAAEAMNAHTDADNPHGITTEDIDAVPTSRKVNGKALSTDISLTAEDVGARPASWMPTVEDMDAVPTSRKVNGKALSADISLTAEDIGARPASWMPTVEDMDAVPTSRKVNGKALSTDISLTAQDVGAAASGHSHSFESLSGKVFHAGTAAPSNKGLLWIDTTANTGGLKYHNGTAWVHVPVAYT